MTDGSAREPLRVGINGFGRIGRLLLRALLDGDAARCVHVNDPAATPETSAHLLRYDSLYGAWPGRARPLAGGFELEPEGAAAQRIGLSNETAPEAVPWPELDLVFECSGRFRTAAQLDGHLRAGAPRVLCSAPTKDPDAVGDFVFGVNHQDLDPTASFATAASCTTNCIAPPIAVVHRHFGIRHGALNTIHAFTATQKLLDDHAKDLRRARAAGESLIPTTTGSATAIGRIFPDLSGKLDGLAIRVPMPGPSVTDLVLELERACDVAAVNDALRQAAGDDLVGVLGFSDEPLVSIDYRGDPRSGIVDGLSTHVQGGTQLRLLVWYDNEWGYVNRMLDLARWWGDALAP